MRARARSSMVAFCRHSQRRVFGRGSGRLKDTQQPARRPPASDDGVLSCRFHDVVESGQDIIGVEPDPDIARSRACTLAAKSPSSASSDVGSNVLAPAMAPNLSTTSGTDRAVGPT
jgi:hypothetical protein